MKNALLGILIIAGIAFIVSRSHQVPENSAGIPIYSQPEVALMKRPEVKQEAPRAVRNERPVVDDIPSEEAIRDEVKHNPEETPPSLVQFAAELGERMEEAMKSETEAKKLFTDLESCATSPKATNSIQAICLNSGRRLSEKFPVLAEKFRGLESTAAPETLRIYRFVAGRP